ncbi:hypothetical protein GQ54DRAFT_300561 [Martensiomyces pterosporus]|nr:hypothetical protein GQ54DRAFT_300561 [Martensiomyces pterosporus]
MRIDMGEFLPKEAVSRRITGDTQFMFQFYKPCIHFYEPGSLSSICMSQDRLRRSLIVALHSCPLLLGKLKVQPDLTISVEYSPTDCNPPTLEFQRIPATFADFKAHGFAYSLAKKHSLDIPIPDGAITRDFDKPMLMVKVSYLGDGGIALFSMTNHVAFDGNAMFSVIAHWAKCNRILQPHQMQASVALPRELQVYATSLITNTENEPEMGPVEISVDASRSPRELALSITKSVPVEDISACVFSIGLDSVSVLKEQVERSGVLGAGEWVSTNNVLVAFIVQCVARANTDSQVYEAGSWTVFQSLDMRKPLGLPLHGLGSPLILAECQTTLDEIARPECMPAIAKRVRRCVDKYTSEYLQNAMDWVNYSYRQITRSGTSEPWRHFWFTALNTNRRCVGVSCMNKIPIYDADFGGGRPVMARSFNPRPNYIIVFPGPPTAATRIGSALPVHDSLHLYVTLERKAMEALKADRQWSSVCTLISEF